ncbi:MAG: DUF2127 domain-containing protein [Bryobacteraceae bacterium]
MQGLRRDHVREALFRLSVSLKGLDAALEIVGGMALLTMSRGFILRAVAFLTQGELAEDPRDLIANYLLHAAHHFSLGTQHFAALYLLSHGITKVLLVVALLKDRRWSYPLALIVFSALIVYQLYRFTFTGAYGLIALSVFDLIVIGLIWLEYRAVRTREG